MTSIIHDAKRDAHALQHKVRLGRARLVNIINMASDTRWKRSLSSVVDALRGRDNSDWPRGATGTGMHSEMELCIYTAM